MEQSNIQDDASLMSHKQNTSPSHEAQPDQPQFVPQPPGSPARDPQAVQRQRQSYEKSIGEFIGSLIILIILFFLYFFIKPPVQSEANDNAIIFGFIFISTQILRIIMAWCITRKVYRTGFISTNIIYGYVAYLILAFAIFVAQNVFAYMAISRLQFNGFQFLLVFTIAFGYVIYYVVLVVILCLLPILLCICCCCPRVLMQNGRGWRPTPQNILSRLTRTQFSAQTHESMKECVICQVEYKDGDNLITLNCDARHYFHADCIETWLKQNGICPICRTPATVEN